MRIGIHRMHNRFPTILYYLLPRRLTTAYFDSHQPPIYKWLWFYITL